MIARPTKVLETENPLALGDRVRMSELGLARHPRYATLEGVIVGKVSSSGLRVKFDARKHVQTIHQSYLVKIAET